MASKLPVSDVVCDGSHFAARSEMGPFEGTGIFHLNTTATGGNISGTIKRGPAAYIGKNISIDFDSLVGHCTFR